MVKRNVVTPDAAVVPAAATVYCMGIESYTSEVGPSGVPASRCETDMSK